MPSPVSSKGSQTNQLTTQTNESGSKKEVCVKCFTAVDHNGTYHDRVSTRTGADQKTVTVCGGSDINIIQIECWINSEYRKILWNCAESHYITQLPKTKAGSGEGRISRTKCPRLSPSLALCIKSAKT